MELSPSGDMIFLNSHVIGISWSFTVVKGIRFYPPCIYYRENRLLGA